jgi:hypothetical protein
MQATPIPANRRPILAPIPVATNRQAGQSIGSKTRLETGESSVFQQPSYLLEKGKRPVVTGCDRL